MSKYLTIIQSDAGDPASDFILDHCFLSSQEDANDYGMNKVKDLEADGISAEYEVYQRCD